MPLHIHEKIPRHVYARSIRETCKEAEKRGDLLQCGGTGVKQEDQIVMIMLEKATGIHLKYIPIKSGGEVAKNLVGGHIDLSVNNPPSSWATPCPGT